MDKKGGCSIAGSPFTGTDTVSVLVLDDGDKKNRGSDCADGNSRGLYGDRGAGSGRGERRCGQRQAIRQRKAGSALYLLDGSYLDDAGYLHVPDGSLTLRVKNYKGSLQRIFLNLDFLYNQPVLAEVFARDEGNSYPYSLGDGRILLQAVPENRYLKVYPYGKVSDFYIRIQTADASGNAAAGSYGELVVKYHGLSANGTIPFRFRAGRFVVLWAAVFGMLLLKKDSKLHQISFDAQDTRGRQKRFVVVLGFTAILLAGAFFFVRINPACRQNLAVHHAQYQELAEALSEGKVSVGDAEEALLAMKNPYDTIALQAAGIGYRADYAYHNGKYYVYFGIVPVLLLYLPYYLLTGGALQNYVAVFVFFAGFIIAAAGFVYELMKRYFKEQPFYLWAVGTGMLVGSYSMFYLLIRPDLYHVPIAASTMFATGGLWLYLAGLNRPKKAVGLYAFGSFCMALTAGCRPQFILFAALAVVLFWERVFVKRELFSKKGWRQTAALVVPYVLIAAGLMAYNALRFGSPFDFGASYSMTSNDMTHRGTEFGADFVWNLVFPVRADAAGRKVSVFAECVDCDGLSRKTGNGKLVWRDFRLQYADLGDFFARKTQKKRCTFQRTDVVLLRFPCSSACDWLCGCKRRGNFDPLWLRRVLWHLFGGGCGSAWGSESGAAEKGLWPVCRLAEGSDFLSGSGVVSDFGQ